MKSIKLILFSFVLSLTLAVGGAAQEWQERPKPPEKPVEKDKKKDDERPRDNRDEKKKDDKKKPD